MDILRWGYEDKGIFTTKEAYNIIIQEQINRDNLWERIWDTSNWPKVSTFLWLLGHNRILTWDNLRKRSFSGPSICYLCRQEEETTLHLMQNCQTGRKLWEKVAFRCQREGRVQGDLKATLREWSQKPFQSNLLNNLWQLIPGLLMWNIWKERNRRIFKDQMMPLDQIWNKFHQNIMETLSITAWHTEDLPTTPLEKAIWGNWEPQIKQNSINKKNLTLHSQEATSWSPPPLEMHKLNFDGASKGNPGKAGYGGAFRDHMGNPHCIYRGSIGWDTNNSAELEGLWRGLKIAHEKEYFPLIIEGDSQILIRMITKLQHGSSIHKVSNSWRMAQRLELTNQWLSQHQEIVFKHTRREGNKLADILANIGVEAMDGYYEGTIDNLNSREQIAKIQEIIIQDNSQGKNKHPDAGVNLSI